MMLRDLLKSCILVSKLLTNLSSVFPRQLYCPEAGFGKLERSVTKLTEIFLVHCKIKGKPDSAETVVLVDGYLTKRACCWFSRLVVVGYCPFGEQEQALQYFTELPRFHHTCDFLKGLFVFIYNQSCFDLNFTANIFFPGDSQGKCCVSSSFNRFCSYELHNMNIIKNLPGVDALTAFAYFFDAESTRKYVSSRSLAEERQISSLLLGSMLDVVEEVQLARLELRNLIQCIFCSESVEQLDLQLYFLNLKSGKRAIFTFDLSCLKDVPGW
nr:PREDICTED: uncharacterized protein LOC108201807 isoform X2 [Daucus carota subsp. sativus]